MRLALGSQGGETVAHPGALGRSRDSRSPGRVLGSHLGLRSSPPPTCQPYPAAVMDMTGET